MLLDKTGKVIETHTGFKYDKGIEKIINLAVLLEKSLPGNGTPAQRAQNLAQWLRGFQGFRDNGPDQKELEALIAKDLK